MVSGSPGNSHSSCDATVAPERSIHGSVRWTRTVRWGAEPTPRRLPTELRQRSAARCPSPRTRPRARTGDLAPLEQSFAPFHTRRRLLVADLPTHECVQARFEVGFARHLRDPRPAERVALYAPRPVQRASPCLRFDCRASARVAARTPAGSRTDVFTIERGGGPLEVRFETAIRGQRTVGRAPLGSLWGHQRRRHRYCPFGEERPRALASLTMRWF